MNYTKARRRLARIRCALAAIKSLQTGSFLPHSLCFVAREVQYTLPKDVEFPDSNVPFVKVKVFSTHDNNSELLTQLNLTRESVVLATGEEFSNDGGDWILLTERYIEENIWNEKDIATPKQAWILLRPRRMESTPVLVPKYEQDGHALRNTEEGDASLFGGILIEQQKTPMAYLDWLSVVEDTYMLQGKSSVVLTNELENATLKLCSPPTNWNMECDEELARFLVESAINGEGYLFEDAKKYIESIDVSTATHLSSNLIDGNPDTFWESDGTQGRHYVRLHMKNGVVIKQLLIGVDSSDDNFMPYLVTVHGKTVKGESKQLSETLVHLTFTGNVCVLENAVEFYKVIEIKIKECRDDGIDCRVHGIKIVSSKQKSLGLNRDMFSRDLVRFTRLASANGDQLYARGKVLLRFMALLDSIIGYMLPMWEFTAGTFKCLESIRQLLPLSRKRGALIENCLRDSQSNEPESIPKIYLNRHSAAEHLVDPKLDPLASNALFNQLFEALRPERLGMTLDYRWSQKYEQWWECKFIGEGIIDQGGGFRDSLADIAEELCPSSVEAPVPLPFFVRSPNQLHGSLSVSRDSYVPNHSCLLFKKYEWIGLLMGASLRAKEHLVLSLPPFIWKQLVDEKVKWDKDYITIDAAEVKLHTTLQNISKDTYSEKFYGLLTYSTVLSDNSIVELKRGGSECFVEFNDLQEYVLSVQRVRMDEFKQQVGAIKRGLLRSVPKAVLDLLTWQELERQTCGDPEVSVEALRRSAHYDDIAEDDLRIKQLWIALGNFTNADRSRFLRFVTGRRRLPTSLYISSSKPGSPIDSLPESATCSSNLFLPPYSSVKVAEEKIRYAAYNCVAIDADTSPWEE